MEGESLGSYIDDDDFEDQQYCNFIQFISISLSI